MSETSLRFASWFAWPARLLLAVFALLVFASAVVPIAADTGPPVPAVALPGFHASEREPPVKKRDADLALYDRVIEDIRRGGNYYDVVGPEHAKAHFPVRPGMAVRLPTLAYISAAIGHRGLIACAWALVLAILLVWWRRLGAEAGGERHRPLALALLVFGCSLALNPNYLVLHDLWAGLLLALAFGLHRPGRWIASIAVTALAVAIRELALPFVLLIGATAVYRRAWAEALAWAGLTLAFAAAMAAHLALVASHVGPHGMESPSWLALRGLGGWLANVELSSGLRYLPAWVAGPVVILTMLGWAGWKSPAGTFGTLLYAGYGLAFMIVGRPGNFYWGTLVVPALFVGLVQAPGALAALIAAARRPAGAAPVT